VRSRGVYVDLDKIPFDDASVYKLFAAGATVGIFQFESGGMRDYLRKLGPTCINDLIAMNALYRPGPLDSGMINVYIECKRGLRESKYEHPLLEAILKDTYGVIVFQEQVLKIAQEMAGYSLGKADILRKAIGKKQVEVMAAQKNEFIDGAIKRGIGKDTAEKVFDQIETFSRYGFVKAHATGYAVIAYKTAYLKTHYPQEFLAASLTSELGDTSKILVFKKECKELGTELLPPDINEGYAHFSVSNGKVVFGLAGVKNVGVSAAESIVKAREEHGKFTDIFDFCSRVDLRLVNKKALESLVAAGAFDSLHKIRAQVYESIEMAVNYGSQAQKEIRSGQSSLFGQATATPVLMKPRLKDVPPWNDTFKRDMEKRILGFYLSSHPLEDNYIEFIAFAETTLDNLSALSDGKKIIVGGVIQSVKVNISRANKQYAVISIEDFNDTAEVMVFSDCLEKRKKTVVEGSRVLILGQVSTREGEKPKVKAFDIIPLELAYKEIPCSLHLFVDAASIDETKFVGINSLLAGSKGNSEVFFHFLNGESELISRSRKYKVEPTPELLRQLAAIFGDEKIKLKANPAKLKNGIKSAERY
jgi:DNA polymerase-3 subunit alpha